MAAALVLAILAAGPGPRGVNVPAAHSPPLTDFAFANDGRTLVSVDGAGTVVRWDPTTGRTTGVVRLGPFPTHAAPLFAVGPGGRHVAVGSSADPPRVYDAATGAVVATLPRPLADADAWFPAFSGDGGRVVFGYYRGHGSPVAGPAAVPVWDVARARVAGTVELPLPPGGIVTTRIALSPDGTRLAAVTAPSPQPGGGGAELGAWDVATGRRLGTRHLAHDLGTTVTYLPDGRGILVHQMNELAVWTPDDDRWRKVAARWSMFGSVVFAPDGRTFAVPVGAHRLILRVPPLYEDARYAVFETATLAERELLPGPAPADAVYTWWVAAFTPGGRALATARTTGGPTTVRVFDLTNAPAGAKVPPGPEELWAGLAGPAPQAGRAIRHLTARPAAAVALLREMLTGAKPAALDAATTARLITQLDAPAFADREAAGKRLAAAGRSALPELRAAHAAAASPEQRERLAALLARFDKLTPGELRHVRAVEVLEKIGTPEAVGLVRALAGGVETAVLTREARVTLVRLPR